MDSRSRKRICVSLEQVAKQILGVAVRLSTGRYDGLFDKMVTDVHSIIKTLKHIEENYYKYSLLEDEEKAISPSSSSLSKIVGLRDERNELKEAIVDRFVNHPYFLLHGMAGVGKTALAREMFDDLDIMDWFESRVWVT